MSFYLDSCVEEMCGRFTPQKRDEKMRNSESTLHLLPRKMKAYVIEKHISPSDLKLSTGVALPVLAPGQVLVKVEYAGKPPISLHTAQEATPAHNLT